ncbi:hypothetical protein EXIGLDRAFT_429421 [Exidia glandulosa HHB12029]|uniref:Uncharacterized protein n=1 Tax=Exidia glandulosa HHB12029 TaxID=1314781 RepID=A0A165BBJ9_EXIGL|nr:hypothetical protein EXIGLDRAFT_429421 [Exidia glandulosa HHB12029]
MDAGGPDGDLRELLKLYRDRDARDAKIRSLEQALAEAQRVTPGGSQEETGKLAVQVQQLQENVTAYSRKCDELRGVKDAHEATIKTLRSTLDDNFRSLGELQQSNAASEIVIQKAEQRNSTLAATVEKLRDQIATHETTVSELRAVIASMTAELAGSGGRPDQASLPTPLMSDNGSSSLDGDDGEGQGAMQARIADLSMQLQEAKSEVDSLHGQLTSHQDENVALQARIKELEDADHSERVRELEVECEDKTRELATSEARATALTAELDAVSGQIPRLKSAYNDKLEEAIGFAATVIDLKKRVEYAENQYGESVVRVAELSQQKEVLETEVKGKDIELERIRSALAAADNDRATLRTNAAEKTSRIAELEAAVSDLTVRFTLANEEKGTLSVALETTQGVLGNLNGKLREKTAELEANVSLKTALEAEMAEVREELSQMATLQEQVTNSEKLAAKLGAELTAAAQHANNVQTDLDTTRKKLAALEPLEKEVLELRTSATSTRAELETATAKLAKLQASWKELEGVRAQLVEAEQRASDLDTQLVAARSEALTTPTTRRLQVSVIFDQLVHEAQSRVTSALSHPISHRDCHFGWRSERFRPRVEAETPHLGD